MLLILCTMVPVQDLHLDAKLATLGEKLAVLCEALEAQGMNSITSHFLQSLRSAPSAQSLLQAMAAAVPELLPGFHPVAPQPMAQPVVSQPVVQQQQPVVSQPMAPQFAKQSAPSVQPMMPAPLNPPCPLPSPSRPLPPCPLPSPSCLRRSSLRRSPRCLNPRCRSRSHSLSRSPKWSTRRPLLPPSHARITPQQQGIMGSLSNTIALLREAPLTAVFFELERDV